MCSGHVQVIGNHCAEDSFHVWGYNIAYAVQALRQKMVNLSSGGRITSGYMTVDEGQHKKGRNCLLCTLISNTSSVMEEIVRAGMSSTSLPASCIYCVLLV